jgi:amidase
VGSLHGLPISLKDNFKLKGLDSTVGIAAHIDDPADSDSPLAQLLEAAGAVFYVKTNVPTAMMIAETVNNVFGRTVNPRNRLTTSGGSSGGESSLIVLRGSPLGVGSDIGTLPFSFPLIQKHAANSIIIQAGLSVFQLLVLVCSLSDLQLAVSQ